MRCRSLCTDLKKSLPVERENRAAIDRAIALAAQHRNPGRDALLHLGPVAGAANDNNQNVVATSVIAEVGLIAVGPGISDHDAPPRGLRIGEAGEETGLPSRWRGPRSVPNSDASLRKLGIPRGRHL